ncbi:hypothetical protein [Streptomyces sp. 11x1]|nr:hypothetical protein [Streptomyces sp. 11x1]WNZ09813.1 hypothetical protein P8T65_20895 [Streptomyces sp. 11x1]
MLEAGVSSTGSVDAGAVTDLPGSPSGLDTAVSRAGRRRGGPRE